MRFKYYLRGAGIGVIVATLILSIAFLFHDNISDEEVIRRAMKLGMIMEENTPGTLADLQQSGASEVDLENGADGEGNTKTDADPLDEPDGTDAPSKQPDENPSSNQPSDENTDPSDHESDQNGDSPSADQPSGNKTGDDADPSSKDQPSSNGKKNENADNPSNNKKDENQPSENKKDENQPSGNQSDNQSNEVEIVIESGDVSRMVSAKVFEAGLVDDADEFNSYLGSNDYDNMLQPGTYKIKKGASFRQIARILTRQ